MAMYGYGCEWRDLVRLDLVRLDLVRLNLVRVDLVRLVLVRLDLVRLDLVRLDLVRLNLVRVDLVRLDLVRLDLVRLNLVRVDLVRVDLVRTSEGITVHKKLALPHNWQRNGDVDDEAERYWRHRCCHFTSTFSVTPSRLGDVTVSFTCDVKSWDLNCDGVNSLAPVVPVNPTDFYCTSHTDSSLDLQWVHPGNTLYSLVFVLDYRLVDDKDDVDDRNIMIPADKSETIHTTTLKELQPGSLYYFRLVVDGGSLGQSEAVTTTCFTRCSEVSESSGTSVGAGVAIGIAITLAAALAVCLGVAYVFRRKVSAICSGKTVLIKTGQTMAVLSQLLASQRKD
ncbi:uncharacterized protein LOC124274388 [Haliotis rubra]|uniref:uncharacterized protein LOC124274388 n=1 Tax=Haliotis rubra TaxID=36100 RepID=UPI001EE5089E|nr:uncharacterized protein LOC124274388 [Haliotis rubra]